MATSLPPLTGDTSWIDNPTGMEGLPTPIAPVRPLSPLGSAAAAAAAAPTARESALGLGAGGTPDVAAVPALTLPGSGIVSQVTTWIAAHLEDFVFIIIGLILIGAAVFSFKPAQDAVVSTAKRAAEVAA